MENISIPQSNVAIGKLNPVFTIAEIGKGFIQSKEEKTTDEYLKNAKLLIKAAAESGASSVKFQTHNVEDEQLNINVIANHFTDVDRYSWVKRNTEATPTEFWQELKKYADSLGVIFFSAPMSRGAAKILENDVNIQLWKIGSADILDFVLLDYVANTGKPIIFSTGMSSEEETDKAVQFLKERTDKLIIMHCVSIYPCAPEKLNIASVPYLEERYELPVGFSSHSTEWHSSIAAVKLGAVALEKHFTFDRNLWGSDHKVSLLPNEFKDMVDNLDRSSNFDVAPFYGMHGNMIQEEEQKFRPLFRKGLVAGEDVAAGTILTKEMLYAMRPQIHIEGVTSDMYEKILGKKLKKTIKKYTPLTLDLVE